MKIQVYESDGVYKGGLLKLDVFNAMTCRMWHAKPDPSLQESLIDISTFEGTPSRYSWFRLSLPKRQPNGPWPALEDDEFDPDAQAYRLSPKEARQWLEAQGFTPPEDLLKICNSGDSVQSGLDTDPDDLFMPPTWFDAEYGIPSERLRGADRTGRIRSIKRGSRRLYSVADAIQCWPEDRIEMPANSG
ncbi:MAG: hypothetical protein AAGI37_19165 [Planctomycetota bacterium]